MAEDFAEKHRNVGFNNAVVSEMAAKPGLLYPLVGSTDNYSGEGSHRIENRFDELAMTEQVTRNEDTNLSDVDSVVRFIKPRRAGDVATMIDKNDQKVTEVNLGDPLAQAVAKAARRYHDDSWLLGYYGNAWGGENGDTAIPFGASHTIVHGSAGITKNKLIDLRELMQLKDNDFDEEMPVILITPYQESDLLGITEYVNSDYQDGHPLVRGEIKPWLGFRFVKFNPGSTTAAGIPAYQQASLTKPGSQRLLPAFFPSGLHRGVWTEFMGDIGTRRDKKANLQIYGEARSSVVRVNEDKCFILECNE